MEGRLITRQWEGEDGVKKSVNEIQVENVQFLNRAKEGTSPETADVSADKEIA